MSDVLLPINLKGVIMDWRKKLEIESIYYENPFQWHIVDSKSVAHLCNKRNNSYVFDFNFWITHSVNISNHDDLNFGLYQLATVDILYETVTPIDEWVVLVKIKSAFGLRNTYKCYVVNNDEELCYISSYIRALSLIVPDKLELAVIEDWLKNSRLNYILKVRSED